MEHDILKSLLDPTKREELFNKILKELKSFDNYEEINYQRFKISEGVIPILTIGDTSDINKIKNVKLFVGAQHNEYNGLFGILKFFRMIKSNEIQISEILREDQILIFAPLMNPYGFLHPTRYNKSGYFLRNGSNLNRFWRRTFAPEFKPTKFDFPDREIPEHVYIIKDLLQKYWDREEISIFVLDFHETSLLYKFPRELSAELNPYYKFDHWLKEGIIQNIIELSNIKYFREPLFYRCNSSADHTHINLTQKQLDNVFHKLHEYMVANQEKLAFYFCYANKSEYYCKKLVEKVYNKLKNILWETIYPAFAHYFHDHGCFVGMSDATPREGVYNMELESQKQFFDLFEEIEKSKSDPEYFNKKLKIIDKSLQLVVTAIREMIKLF